MITIMSRRTRTDGTVVWQAGLIRRTLWSALVVGMLVLSLGARIWLLGIITAWCAYVVWSNVLRPRLTATNDGLEVRQAFRVVRIAWTNVADVRPSYFGLDITVRIGQHVSARVPIQARLARLTGAENEADDAVDYILTRTAEARRAENTV